jgi:hypothetical protein
MSNTKNFVDDLFKKQSEVQKAPVPVRVNYPAPQNYPEEPKIIQIKTQTTTAPAPVPASVPVSATQAPAQVQIVKNDIKNFVNDLFKPTQHHKEIQTPSIQTPQQYTQPIQSQQPAQIKETSSVKVNTSTKNFVNDLFGEKKTEVKTEVKNDKTTIKDYNKTQQYHNQAQEQANIGVHKITTINDISIDKELDNILNRYIPSTQTVHEKLKENESKNLVNSLEKDRNTIELKYDKINPIELNKKIEKDVTQDQSIGMVKFLESQRMAFDKNTPIHNPEVILAPIKIEKSSNGVDMDALLNFRNKHL